MINVALKGLLGRKLRAALTGFAIVLGVAMISGAFVLTDTLGQSFDSVYNDSYKATDAVISSKVATKTNDDGTTTQAPAFPGDVLQRVQGLPGVQTAEGSIEDDLRFVDSNDKAIGRRRGDSDRHRPDRRTAPESSPPGQRSWPQGDGEIAVDVATAQSEQFRVGQTVGAFGDGPARAIHVSGIVRFGSQDSIGGTTIAVFDLATAQRLFDKVGKLDVVRVGAAAGTSQDELISQITPLLSSTTQVKTAEAQAAADSKDSQQSLNIIKYFLLGFGGIAYSSAAS